MTQLLKRTLRLLFVPCAVALAASCLQSCEKDILTGQPSWLGNSIYERLEQGIEVDGQTLTFNTTLRLIDDLEQTAVLSKTGSKTLFVTSDQAYAEWFKNNDWGVRSYEQLSLAQKKLLFNNSMINNAYLLELMSNVSGNPPQEGLCMRRTTATSIYDTIPTMEVSEMPVNPMLKDKLDSWADLRDKNKTIAILKNDQSAPMIHFLPEFMAKNNITDEDLQILTNGGSESISDSWINGKKVISNEQTCKNGYVYVVDGVIESSQNMAEIIRTNPQMSGWSKLIDRFCAPFPASPAVQADYRRLYNKSESDTLYVLRYYWGDPRNNADALVRTPNGYTVPAKLAFDPGMNQYMWKNTMGYDMHYDAGAMIVPTNDALDRWWNNAGKGLKEEYGSWENVPALTLSKLLNVNMLPSFVDAVPSKFKSIVDDSKVELGIRKEDVVACYMGCNGVIYLVDKVFGPSEYRSVVYPALTYQSKMSVIYYAIDNYDFGPFLNSMESRFSLMLPYNTHEVGGIDGGAFFYLDPCSFGQPTQTLYIFYYDSEDQTVAGYGFDCTVDEFGEITIGESKGAISSAIIQNRLSDLVDNLIVVGDIESGQRYYKTKAGSVISVVNNAGSIELQGGYQMETGQKIIIDKQKDWYDMTESGNGISYGIDETNPLLMTASKSVYQVLKENAAAQKDSLFFKLLADDETSNGLLSNTSGTTSVYYCVNDEMNRNISLFDNYNYTVYVPSDESIKEMIDAGYLPTWEDYKDLSEAADRGDQTALDSQEKIAEIIHDFVRYHIQDNSVYIDGDPVNGVKYETAKLNPKNKRYFSLNVTADKTSLTVVDQLGATRKVVKDGNFYNKTCREYWISGKSTSKTRLLYSSSNAVVHKIDGVLLYDESQKTNWRSLMPSNN